MVLAIWGYYRVIVFATGVVDVVMDGVVCSRFCSTFVEGGPSPFSLSGRSVARGMYSKCISSGSVVVLSSMFFPLGKLSLSMVWSVVLRGDLVSRRTITSGRVPVVGDARLVLFLV